MTRETFTKGNRSAIVETSYFGGRYRTTLTKTEEIKTANWENGTLVKSSHGIVKTDHSMRQREALQAAKAWVKEGR